MEKHNAVRKEEKSKAEKFCAHTTKFNGAYTKLKLEYVKVMEKCDTV